MVQKSKGRKSPLKHSQVGLMGAGGLKGNISEFLVKSQNILFYTHDIKKTTTWHESIYAALTLHEKYQLIMHLSNYLYSFTSTLNGVIFLLVSPLSPLSKNVN